MNVAATVVRSTTVYISNNTVNMALRRMGFDGRIGGHGVRALAMTNIQEQLAPAISDWRR